MPTEFDPLIETRRHFFQRSATGIGTAALATMLALVAATITPKVYEARMTILVQEPAKLNPFLNDLSIGPDLKNRMEGLRALLHSEHILENVLRDIGIITEDTDAKQKQSMINVLSSSINVQLIGNDLIELLLSILSQQCFFFRRMPVGFQGIQIQGKM